ncbi:hypothetical protein I2I05_20210, partial [Hymenobacter sp. BT683]|nr:hypothetical protein [Hymenobacter jeongseonensis]
MQHLYFLARPWARLRYSSCCIVLLLALLLPGWAARAQAPTWQDAFNGGGPLLVGTGTSVARATATDASGNVYVTGSFSNQVAFGSTVLTSAGGTDVFVAKWDATTQAWAWAAAGGGTGTDIGYGVAVDASGNVYATGYVQNAATSATDPTSVRGVRFGSVGLASASASTIGNNDVFVASYTAAGTYRWAAAGGGTGNDIGNGVAVDASGNVYATGQVQNAATSATDQASARGVQFGGAGLASASTNTTANFDVFVASYTAAGAYRWAAAGGGTGTDLGYGVAVDASGNVYATGYVNNAATSATDPTSSLAQRVQFGGAGLASASTSISGTPDVFVASYTAAGAYRWAAAGGGTSNDIGYGVAVDGSGNV